MVLFTIVICWRVVYNIIRNKREETKEMTRKEIFMRYVMALRARRLAQTEGDWAYADKKVRMFKEYFANHPKA